MQAMTSRCRRGAVGLFALVLVSFTGQTRASADGAQNGATTTCVTSMNSVGTCTLDATSGAVTPRLPPSLHSVSGASADKQALEKLLALCRSTYMPPSALPQAAGAKGGWYYAPCARELGIPTTAVGPVAFIPSPTASAGSPARALAVEAQRELVLPVPVMYSSPGPAPTVPKVVNFPTWAWIATGQWRPITASATAGAVTVTATATPRYVRWSWGDGSASICRGPGEVYTPGVSDAAAASPDCGHTYAVTSASGPGEEFPVTATVHWSVTWSATTGEGGQFPDMATSSAQSWIVEQIENPFVPVND